jgi:uncharacterized protein (TIGR00290 family)
MNQSIKVSLSWSGGKDSAFALYHLLQDPQFEVVRLHTIIGEASRRVGMHGIHEGLIQIQADAVGLPLDRIYYPESGDNQQYEKAISAYLDELSEAGIHHLAYGDLFLEDLRAYREKHLASRAFHAVFPLWKQPTEQLARDFIETGFKTLICAADADLIDKDRVGQVFDLEFLENLPENVDPCGENGEFHSFCYAGPIFKKPITVYVEKIVEQYYDVQLSDGDQQRKSFWFAEVGIKAF